MPYEGGPTATAVIVQAAARILAIDERQRQQLPPYAPMLAAYHRAHAAELQSMIAALPLAPGDLVLDMACGAGTYTLLLAERVAPHGQVIGVDISPVYLELARMAAAETANGRCISFRTGDAVALPFTEHTFDLVWCAQSMYTLPDYSAALRELYRVTRPGGTIAIFENDMLHQLVLPWPAELELAVRQAQLRAMADTPDTDTLFSGRDLCRALAQAGLHSCTVTPYATVRHAPLSNDERTFLTGYLADLRERAWPYLDLAARTWLDALLDPRSERNLLNQPDFCVTYINLVARGVK